jgi:putative membrane protein
VRHYHHFYDGIALFATLPRPFHILVALDWTQSPIVNNAMTAITSIARWPVILRADALARPQGPSVFTPADILRYQRRGLREAVDLLGAGRLLVIFPEGYPNIDPHYTPKTRDEELLPFKAGFLSIAVAAEKRYGAKIPLIPVGLRYERGSKWTAHVAFGGAVGKSSLTCRETLLKNVEREVARLSGIAAPGARRQGFSDTLKVFRV